MEPWPVPRLLKRILDTYTAYSSMIRTEQIHSFDPIQNPYLACNVKIT